MSERETLKARLAAEMVHAVFKEQAVPAAAWDHIDDTVDELFADCPTGRLRDLVDDLDVFHACDAHPLEGSSGLTDPANPSLGEDWEVLDYALRTCVADLTEPIKQDVEEASGASSLEVASHWR